MWTFDGQDIAILSDADERAEMEANMLALVRVLNNEQLKVLQAHMIAIIGGGGETIIQLNAEEVTQ
jgi:hypothetical protein